jgi:AcrR family transcriptional regulator
MARPARRAGRKTPPAFLSREDWLGAAVRLLIEEGVDQVKVQRLGKALGTSRGSFYWHFRDRGELLDEILARWERTNTDQLIAALGTARDPLQNRILGLFALWVEHHPFYPRFDNAIRAWAAKSPKVRRVQRAADERRRRHIEQIFLDAGYPPREARVRGDILYFTQVGYFLLDLGESAAERLAKLEPYFLAFTGRPLDRRMARRFRGRLGRAEAAVTQRT